MKLQLIILTFFSHTAVALHCRNRVVLQGYNTNSVLNLCGEPEFIEHATEYINTNEFDRIENHTKGLRLKRRGLRLKHETNHLIPIHYYELWTYTFDQNWPAFHLEFRNGILFDIEDHSDNY